MVLLEDFISGFILAQVTAIVIGPWSLILGILSGVLWAMGGQGILGTKLWRRIGVPLVICLPFAITGHVIQAVISFCLQFLCQSIGYGVPSTQPPDEGSWLGRHFGRFTRIVWFGLLALAMIPLIVR